MILFREALGYQRNDRDKETRTKALLIMDIILCENMKTGTRQLLSLLLDQLHLLKTMFTCSVLYSFEMYEWQHATVEIKHALSQPIDYTYQHFFDLDITQCTVYTHTYIRFYTDTINVT